MRGMTDAASPCTDALRAAGWQPDKPLPCGCTPARLCAPHGWLRDAEQWEQYLHSRMSHGRRVQGRPCGALAPCHDSG